MEAGLPTPCNDWRLRSGLPAPATPGLGSQLLHQSRGRGYRVPLPPARITPLRAGGVVSDAETLRARVYSQIFLIQHHPSGIFALPMLQNRENAEFA